MTQFLSWSVPSLTVGFGLMLTSDLPLRSGRGVSGEWAGWFRIQPLLAMGIGLSSDTSRKLVLASTAKWRPQREFCNFGRFYQNWTTFSPWNKEQRLLLNGNVFLSTPELAWQDFSCSLLVVRVHSVTFKVLLKQSPLSKHCQMADPRYTHKMYPMEIWNIPSDVFSYFCENQCK